MRRFIKSLQVPLISQKIQMDRLFPEEVIIDEDMLFALLVIVSVIIVVLLAWRFIACRFYRVHTIIQKLDSLHKKLDELTK